MLIVSEYSEVNLSDFFIQNIYIIHIRSGQNDFGNSRPTYHPELPFSMIRRGDPSPCHLYPLEICVSATNGTDSTSGVNEPPPTYHPKLPCSLDIIIH